MSGFRVDSAAPHKHLFLQQQLRTANRGRQRKYNHIICILLLKKTKQSALYFSRLYLLPPILIYIGVVISIKKKEEKS